MANQCLQFWKGKTIGDVWPNPRRIICFRETDTVVDCLRILEKQAIISAPVLDGENKLLGIVDTQQLLTFLLGIYPKSIESLEELTAEAFNEIVEKGKAFSDSSLKDVLEVNTKFNFGWDDVFPVELSTPIEKLLDMFYLGVHRVPVIGKDGSINNIISQTDFLSVLGQTLPLLGDINSKTLRELRLNDGKTVTAVGENKSVLSVLATLHRNRFSAVPVVDSQGHIVANFSSSNLKDTNVYNFAEMLVGVKEFLMLQNLRPAPFLVKLAHQKSLHPITVTLDASFHSVVTEMAASKVHRIWVVDGDKKLVGVVSLGDIYQVFLPWGAPWKFANESN